MESDSKIWKPFPRAKIELRWSEKLDEEVVIFSNNLKDKRGEWLEWFPDDVIYLRSEVKVLANYGANVRLLRNLHEEKKLVMERLLATTPEVT